MICGMIVMIFAFIAAGLLQTAIEVYFFLLCIDDTNVLNICHLG